MEGFHRKLVQSVKHELEEAVGNLSLRSHKEKALPGVTAKRRDLHIFVNSWIWMGSSHLGWDHLPRGFQTEGVGIGLSSSRLAARAGTSLRER